MHIDANFFKTLHNLEDKQLLYGIKALAQGERNTVLALAKLYHPESKSCENQGNKETTKSCDEILKKITEANPDLHEASNFIVSIVLGILNMLWLRTSSSELIAAINSKKLLRQPNPTEVPVNSPNNDTSREPSEPNGAYNDPLKNTKPACSNSPLINIVTKRKTAMLANSPMLSPSKPRCRTPQRGSVAPFSPLKTPNNSNRSRRVLFKEPAYDPSRCFKLNDSSLVLPHNQAELITSEEFWNQIHVHVHSEKVWTSLKIPGAGKISREKLIKCIEWRVNMSPLKLIEWCNRMDNCDGWNTEYPNGTIIDFIIGRHDKLDFSNSKTLEELNFEGQFELNGLLPAAVLLGHTDIVKKLIENNADINAGAASPLHLAIECEDEEMTQLLIELGANVNLTCDKGYSAATLIIWFIKNLEITKACLDKVEDINKSDIHGCTLLHHALLADKNQAAQLILNCNAEVGISNDMTSSPLITSITRGNLEAFEWMIEKVADINQQDSIGYTLLHWAAAYGRLEMAEFLLDKGAEINLKDDIDYSPLALATLKNDLEMVKLLLQRDADISSVNVSFSGCLSPLQSIALIDPPVVFEELLNRGAKKLDDWNEAVDLLTNLKLYKPHDYKKYYGMLSNVPLDSIANYAKYQLLSKSVGNSFEIEKILNLIPQNSSVPPKKVELMGAWSIYWIKHMLKALPLFKERFSGILSEDEYKNLKNILEFTYFNYENKDEIVKRIFSAEATLLLTGCLGHAGTMMVWGNYLSLCEMDPETPIQFFQYNSPKKIPQLVPEFLMSKFYTKGIFEKIKYDLFDGIECLHKDKNNILSILEENFPFEQNTGNCSYVSLLGIIWAYLIINALNETSADPHEVITKKTADFSVLCSFMQAYHMERYLGARIIRPTEGKDEKVDTAYKLDEEFIQEAFSMIVNSHDHRINDLFAKLKEYRHH